VETKTDKFGHGTGVLVHAITSMYGVTKKSNVVIVKLGVAEMEYDGHVIDIAPPTIISGALVKIRDIVASKKTLWLGHDSCGRRYPW
jgi:CheY-specific phosphatase CheX